MERWIGLPEKIRGMIYNVYSKEDNSLRFELTETTIGRNPIELPHPNIYNHELKLGHSQY